MSGKRVIGALSIGQSPRPNLIKPLNHIAPQAKIIEAGALDDIDAAAGIPPVEETDYPLITTLRNKQRVVVSERFLTPHLQQAAQKLAEAGADVLVLLCAGTFAELSSPLPLFKPFAVGRALLQTMGMKDVGFITPLPAQIPPIEARWQAAGFRPMVWSADLSKQDRSFRHQLHSQILRGRLECLALDYVGHPIKDVQILQRSIDLPVIDIGMITLQMAASC